MWGSVESKALGEGLASPWVIYPKSMVSGFTGMFPSLQRTPFGRHATEETGIHKRVVEQQLGCAPVESLRPEELVLSFVGRRMLGAGKGNFDLQPLIHFAWMGCCLMGTLTSLFTFPLVMGIVLDAAAEERGLWVKQETWAQVNTRCMQVWICNPRADVVHDAASKIVTTSQETAWGTCSAGAGPADSCNACLSSEPNKPCVWHLEK